MDMLFCIDGHDVISLFLQRVLIRISMMKFSYKFYGRRMNEIIVRKLDKVKQVIPIIRLVID